MTNSTTASIHAFGFLTVVISLMKKKTIRENKGKQYVILLIGTGTGGVWAGTSWISIDNRIGMVHGEKHQ